MYRWNNDYNQGAHPAVLKCLEETNSTSFAGYGLDIACEETGNAIRSIIGRGDADIHFLTGGTQANFTVIAAALRPFQSVVSSDCGHIFAHETGAVEATGHKVETSPAVNGKLTAAGLEAIAHNFRVSTVQEHITCPKMVYISFPTELGTVYSLAELEAIRAVCDEYGLYLYIDGARLPYGLAADGGDVTIQDIARLADAFYLGGTKCGTLFGEAVVLLNNDLKSNFRSYIKQNGGMLAKGWLLGLQFGALLKDNLYFTAAERANTQAMRIKKAFLDAGFELYVDSPTNQQFVIVTDEQKQQLDQNHISEYEAALDNGRHAIRFCTSWATEDHAVDSLVADIVALNN